MATTDTTPVSQQVDERLNAIRPPLSDNSVFPTVPGQPPDPAAIVWEAAAYERTLIQALVGTVRFLGGEIDRLRLEVEELRD